MTCNFSQMENWIRSKLPECCLVMEKFQEWDLFNGISLRYCLKFNASILFQKNLPFGLTWVYFPSKVPGSHCQCVFQWLLFSWLLCQPYPFRLSQSLLRYVSTLVIFLVSTSVLGISLFKYILSIFVQIIKYQ